MRKTFKVTLFVYALELHQRKDVCDGGAEYRRKTIRSKRGLANKYAHCLFTYRIH